MPKKKTLAKKLVSGLKKFSRDLKAGKPLKVTRVNRNVVIDDKGQLIAVLNPGQGAYGIIGHSIQKATITYTVKGAR